MDSTSSIFKWNPHDCNSKKKKKKIQSRKNLRLYLLWDIVFILRHSISRHSISRHSIYFETLYLFRDIVFISRHSIYFETLYLFRDIFILRHCIYFEALYLFRDIVVISTHIHFETLYSFQDIVLMWGSNMRPYKTISAKEKWFLPWLVDEWIKSNRFRK